MSIRDDYYHTFGPQSVEALFDTLLEELNDVRTHLGLPVIPKAGFLGRAHNNLSHLIPYNWQLGP